MKGEVGPWVFVPIHSHEDRSGDGRQIGDPELGDEWPMIFVNNKHENLVRSMWNENRFHDEHPKPW
jgi:hypothetical protein